MTVTGHCNLLPLPRGYSFCRESFSLLHGYFFSRDSCGPPYILLNKKQRIRMKKDYYSDNDRRFPC